MKGFINIQNEDKECFEWYLVRQLNPVNKIPTIIRSIDKEFPKQLNFKGVKFSVHKKDYAKMKKKKIPLMILVVTIKHHTIFILQNKLSKRKLTYYYFQNL